MKNALAYWPARTALALLRPIPLSLALPLSAAVGTALFYLLPDVRRLSEEHLYLAFGDTLGRSDRRRIARRALANIGRCFCEIAKFDAISRQLDRYVEVEGMEIANAILREGRGAIAITGHLGNWELLAAYFAHKGIPVTAVARRIYDDRINDLIVSFRRRHGVETILRHDPQAARKILRTLNRNGLLAMVIDQDTQAPSLSVPFFGHPARTPIAPATLALRRQLPLVAVFIARRPEGGHKITVYPPLPLPRTGNRMADARALVTAMSEKIEAEVRRHPEEWVWWHRRWRRAPVPQLDLDGKFPYGSRAELRGPGL